VFFQFQETPQFSLVKELGISQRSWSDYENGKSDVPVQVVMKLEGYGYPLNWILKGTETSFPIQSYPLLHLGK
jgi:transcriptional regulator with XRE-family HTH domain